MSSVETNKSFQDLVERARKGDVSARDSIFSDCQDYLLFVASQSLDHRVRGKCGPSDIVQNTLMNAASAFPNFRGDSSKALHAWLNEILRNEMATASRKYLGTAKRDVRREMISQTESQFWRVQSQITDTLATPSSEAVLEEDAAELRSAMLRLPEDYRRVLMLRNWERMSFQQIATRFDRSENAVKKLWARALTRLETELFEEGNEQA